MPDQRQLGSSYRLTDRLGSGAIGEVWRGVDGQGRAWAFKLLHRDLVEDPDVTRRFFQERALLSSIVHPNVVRLHDLVVEGGIVALVMDLVRGGDLRARLRSEGPLEPATVARWGGLVAAGLAAAHGQGVLHRDVKPENILVDDSADPQPHLTDFGIAKVLDEAHRTTDLLGTPAYMAPEVLAGQPASAASDLYSLGIVLYEMACGATPFAHARSPIAAARAHASEPVERPVGVPDTLWEVISQLLAKDPAQRPISAFAASDALLHLAPGLTGLPAAPRRVVGEPDDGVATRIFPALGGDEVAGAAGAAGPAGAAAAARAAATSDHDAHVPWAPPPPEPRARSMSRGLAAFIVVVAALALAGITAGYFLLNGDAPARATRSTSTREPSPTGLPLKTGSTAPTSAPAPPTRTPSATPKPSPSSTPASLPAGSKNCGGGVSVGDRTSCGFAGNVAAAARTNGGSGAFTVFSPVTGKKYLVSCTTAGGLTTCRTNKGATIYVVG